MKTKEELKELYQTDLTNLHIAQKLIKGIRLKTPEVTVSLLLLKIQIKYIKGKLIQMKRENS